MLRFDDLKAQLNGEWGGTYLLRLGEPNVPDSVTPSTLSVATIVHGKFLSLKYTWSFNDAPHEGLIILGYDKSQRVATAAWIDSWHQSARILMCEGVVHDNGEVDVKGYYGDPPDPQWGWRTTIKATLAGGALIEMYNCTPEGVEELAVRGDYSRKGGEVA